VQLFGGSLPVVLASLHKPEVEVSAEGAELGGPSHLAEQAGEIVLSDEVRRSGDGRGGDVLAGNASQMRASSASLTL
jgi:hypothetical protein